MSATADELREEVRRRYAESARAVTDGGSCGCGSGSCCDGESDAAKFGELLYDAEQRGELPDAAVLASLGCGNPTAVADLHEGEVVLDLGSGGGIDVILSAKRVGPTGRRLRARHDRRDARARAAERRRRRGHERPFPEGRHRADSASRELGRCRDLELRHQSLDRQGRGADRDRARPQARRPGRRHRHRRRGSSSARRSGPSAAHSSAASRVRSRGASTSPGSKRPGSRTSRSSSRTRSQTACTARSSRRARPKRRRRRACCR